jgi:hypothetical protein
MSRRVLRIFKVRESGNAEFWLSNLFIMASTIIGVYLAAQASQPRFSSKSPGATATAITCAARCSTR